MADPHVITALRSKRAELSGELIAAKKRILQLRADISSLGGAIRVFDPTAEPHTIRPILRRKKPTLIPRGQCGRRPNIRNHLFWQVRKSNSRGAILRSFRTTQGRIELGVGRGVRWKLPNGA
jgi:hypothetical protein